MSPIIYAMNVATRESVPSTNHNHGILFTDDIEHKTDIGASPTAIYTDTAPAPTMPPLASATETPSVRSSDTSTTMNRGMTDGTKIGLSMIPVVVCLCAMWIFVLFWWRKRRLQKGVPRRGPPVVPEKDLSSLSGSAENSRRGSKIYTMAAFSTPVHGNRHRETQAPGQLRQNQPAETVDQRNIYLTNASITKLANLETLDQDSPIDAESPFRLKRGDTVKRSSLGTDISFLWPSPPPAAWVKKQPSIPKRMASSPLSQEATLTKLPQCSCGC